MNAPIAIGGVGGSGTRLIAAMLYQLNFFVGADLNSAIDNLWFTLLFKRTELLDAHSPTANFERAVRVFQAVMTRSDSLTSADEAWVRSLAMSDRPQHPAAWLRARADSLIASIHNGAVRSNRWGWKEPNTHVFLNGLFAALPGLKYIHVMRNGLDVAHSTNQNQLRLWGRYFLGTDQYEVAPRWSLKYWCVVHRRISTFAEQLPGRVLLLNYDQLCADPCRELQPLIAYLGVSATESTESSLRALVRPPESIGRFRLHGLTAFDADDVAYVRSLGFDVGADGQRSTTST